MTDNRMPVFSKTLVAGLCLALATHSWGQALKPVKPKTSSGLSMPSSVGEAPASLPVVSGPWTEPTSSVTVKAGVPDVPGALGACVSSVTVKLAVLVLPVCAATCAV